MTWGDWDCKISIPNQCKISFNRTEWDRKVPVGFSRYVNMKKLVNWVYHNSRYEDDHINYMEDCIDFFGWMINYNFLI